jgi:multimeric flavodoxin WrbA
MNVIVLHGSPRKRKNSDTFAQNFLDGMNSAGKHEIIHFYLNEMKISPCQGCMYCATSVGHKCKIEDEMIQIYDAFPVADIVVWATPMYWGYMTAQIKAALDRMEAIVMGNGFKNKTFVVFITYRYHYQSTAAFFERICPFFNVEYHILTCRTMDENERDLLITEFPDKLQEASELGKKLGLK